jgi:putative transposase
MSFVRIWVHVVFSTKNREPKLEKELRKEVIGHIMANCKVKDIFLQAISGYSDHLHLLISLGPLQSISKTVQLIKGESSNWINKSEMLRGKFAWQDDYFAVSVSESQLVNVERYIRNQEEHHKTKPFSEEVEQFMNRFGWTAE